MLIINVITLRNKIESPAKVKPMIIKTQALKIMVYGNGRKWQTSVRCNKEL
jgi:hypothetical protein